MKYNNESLSKFLTLILRHKPELIGIQLDEAGWVSIEILLTACCKHSKPLEMDQLLEIVREDKKDRFALSSDSKMIRASQGHSVRVELGYERKAPPAFLYHGTADRFLASIQKDGLEKRKRHHVHLSVSKETALSAGERYGLPILLKVDAERMHNDGHVFFLSTNGVWLTDAVPPQYISIVA